MRAQGSLTKEVERADNEKSISERVEKRITSVGRSRDNVNEVKVNKAFRPGAGEFNTDTRPNFLHNIRMVKRWSMKYSGLSQREIDFLLYFNALGYFSKSEVRVVGKIFGNKPELTIVYLKDLGWIDVWREANMKINGEILPKLFTLSEKGKKFCYRMHRMCSGDEVIPVDGKCGPTAGSQDKMDLIYMTAMKMSNEKVIKKSKNKRVAYVNREKTYTKIKDYLHKQCVPIRVMPEDFNIKWIYRHKIEYALRLLGPSTNTEIYQYLMSIDSDSKKTAEDWVNLAKISFMRMKGRNDIKKDPDSGMWYLWEKD